MFDRLEKLKKEMILYNRGDPMRIQHFLKVHSLCALLGKMESLDDNAQFLLEATALVHDIGARIAEKQFSQDFRAHHEQIGAQEAVSLLASMGGYTEDQIERVKYIVGNHHHYNKIDGLDFQLLVEADFMVNAFEKSLAKEAIRTFQERICKTESGQQILSAMFETQSV